MMDEVVAFSGAFEIKLQVLVVVFFAVIEYPQLLGYNVLLVFGVVVVVQLDLRPMEASSGAETSSPSAAGTPS
eukprot:CAMPEP_0197184204 /NCGR_PEP_ID=MMETSP1423-20130617/9451_1 /TAXON_ID=476441 /ORGANISM="Pseudo-nitzschia heimii, Strain UNC1101" /LENGTH=72 /DNA_ID=CAMNT_0042634973 /DNA_START=165 /DNA_END=383 /DNA_ORIENTATION=+